MRMWMCNPKILCRKHLLGEHVEIHMLVGAIKKHKNLKGFYNNNLIEPQNIESRHKELSLEIINRGFKHNSELPDYKDEIIVDWNINRKKSLQELINRCDDCKMRYETQIKVNQ